MRIPQPGMDVLFVLQAASPEDNRPAVLRPAKIVAVNHYTATGGSVNLIVMLDGQNDINMMNAKNPGRIEGFGMWCTSVLYNEAGNLNTFQWMHAEKWNMRCEPFSTRAKIFHGREVIRAGALGIWDQMNNTITFDRGDVENVPDGVTASYRADTFIDQHCARMDCPEGYSWGAARTEIDPDVEWAGESHRMMQSIRDRAETEISNRFDELVDTRARQMGYTGPRSERLAIPPVRQVSRHAKQELIGSGDVHLGDGRRNLQINERNNHGDDVQQEHRQLEATGKIEGE